MNEEDICSSLADNVLSLSTESMNDDRTQLKLCLLSSL